MNGPRVKDVYAKVLEVQEMLTGMPLVDGERTVKDESDYHRGKAMAHVSLLLAMLPEVIADAVAKRITFPQLSRSLMLAGVKHDSAIDFAIKWYLEALSDHDAVRHRTRDLSDECQKDLLSRHRREIRNHAENLGQVGVSLVNVSVGDRFDEAIHVVIGTMPTKNGSQADTVAQIEGPASAFKWSDDQGNLQTKPVSVVVYEYGETPDEASVEPQAGNRPQNSNGRKIRKAVKA